MAKKTYFTKADLISFGEYLLSDERRAEKQRATRESKDNGTIDPLPWATAVRILTDEDFQKWKEKREKQSIKIEIYNSK